MNSFQSNSFNATFKLHVQHVVNFIKSLEWCKPSKLFVWYPMIKKLLLAALTLLCISPSWAMFQDEEGEENPAVATPLPSDVPVIQRAEEITPQVEHLPTLSDVDAPQEEVVSPQAKDTEPRAIEAERAKMKQKETRFAREKEAWAREKETLLQKISFIETALERAKQERSCASGEMKQERSCASEDEEGKSVGVSVHVPRPLGDNIQIPEIARGFEEDYRRFLRGKLIYTDPTSQKKIELFISDLANPLEGEFDLSQCGDTKKYLSISTGYRKEKRAENSDKIEVWIAPRFLITQNLKGSAEHFQNIMRGWTDGQPVGLFWTWGNWSGLRNYRYSTPYSFDLCWGLYLMPPRMTFSRRHFEPWDEIFSAVRTEESASKGQQSLSCYVLSVIWFP